MNCEKCNIGTCGDDNCDFCDEIICVGLCPTCHVEENCAYCKNKLNLKENDPIRTVGYQYFCNRNCYDNWKL